MGYRLKYSFLGLGVRGGFAGTGMFAVRVTGSRGIGGVCFSDRGVGSVLDGDDDLVRGGGGPLVGVPGDVTQPSPSLHGCVTGLGERR